MKIKLCSYRKRNGDLMLYINRSNRVSVGVTTEGFSPYARRTTNGERNAYNAALQLFADSGKPFTGDLSLHKELGFCAPVSCGDFVLVGTDVGTIGGMSVEADGGYVVSNDRILPQNVWIEENVTYE
jgi:hypothetical protein|tara:strand:+ start:40 stop:420 length:381 start_codon:yes stop_codon:yes gene_type:complete